MNEEVGEDRLRKDRLNTSVLDEDQTKPAVEVQVKR